LKKKPCDLALKASAVEPSAADTKFIPEGSKTTALSTGNPDDASDAYEAISMMEKTEDKKNPPLA
jgi:hypothetical protein